MTEDRHTPEPPPTDDTVGRRDFLRLMTASLALAGLAGCTRRPTHTIIPYARKPEEIVPGNPLFFATAMPLGGVATGLLVESHTGRPTKAEGNPGHPASLGATDVFAQASILSLYDPARSQSVVNRASIGTWSDFLAEIAAVRKGAALRLLTETVTSPTLVNQIQTLGARWHSYEPVRAPLDRHYRLDRADVILALDSDFLTCGPGHVRYARDFAARRAPPNLNRLYAVESMPTGTGALADHRRPMRSCDVESFARAVASALDGVKPPDDWTAALVHDLQRHHGSSLVVAGDHQPPAVHAIALAINHKLGNVGTTVICTESLSPPTGTIEELVKDMADGHVELLVILAGNPVYTAPADLDFAKHLERVPLRVHLGLYEDETSRLCHWHIPEAHYLEAWSDALAFDGTASILQPLIAPLYDGKSAHEMLAALAGQGAKAGYDIVRDYWKGRHPADFETFWRTALHDGLVAGTALPARTPKPKLPPETGKPEGLEIVFRPDPAVWDGRFAGNGWLQELPRPITHLTWDNAAILSPATARRLGLASEDVVELDSGGRKVRAPLRVLPGHADDSVTVHLGYGRDGIGFNAYLLRTSASPGFAAGLKIARTGERYRLAGTQQHHLMEGRDPIRPGKSAPKTSLYPSVAYEGHAWGMAIDLGACTGCNACVVACQAENNIPVVGKDQVLISREMHWLRIDTYYGGPEEDPETFFQPVLCMHCENAPCEAVCPVNATVHSHEGLNDQIYNRCVGTRYCSNNCPYKVRRFNFYQYTDAGTPGLKLMRNPDVTVRSRGVMEKCTYCVQRISAARIRAARENRRVRDGEILTACQSACPSSAIVFGDVNDPTSRVAKLKADARSYALLEGLNTRPRTTYLAKVRNPNPEIRS